MDFDTVIKKVIRHFRKPELPGCCGTFAAWANNCLIKQGFTSHRIIFGYVDEDEGGGNYVIQQHIWIEYNGIKYDPTIVQFNNPRYSSKPYKEIYHPYEYAKKKTHQIRGKSYFQRYAITGKD